LLTAKPASLWRGSYDISQDEAPLAHWAPWGWRYGGAFELDGERYEIRGNWTGARFQLLDPGGQVVAAAEGVGRKRWTVTVGDEVHHFRRTSFWRLDQELLRDDEAVGLIRQVNPWRGTATADLPGLPRAMQVFALCVVLTMWAAASTG
jgi:hypothetical protein